MAQDKQLNLDVWQEQIIWYRHHLDIFLQDAFGIRLTQMQHVIVRQMGNPNCTDFKLVCPRGFGKTWVTAWAAAGMACLYPQCGIAVCSATAEQATLILGKLAEIVERNESLQAEIEKGNSRNFVTVSNTRSQCNFKNGSQIFSCALSSIRGRRAKFIIVDEARDCDMNEISAIAFPLSNARREISFRNNFEDVDSRIVMLTSACETQLTFYNQFMKSVKRVAQGDERSFVMDLSSRAAVFGGITKRSYFEQQRLRAPSELIYNMQYEGIFVGGATGSFFPMQITQPSRTLKSVQLRQPKKTRAHYAIGLDIATSTDDGADNAVFTVLKWIQQSDGTALRQVVFIRSFHGKKLDFLAEQLRKLYHCKFPQAQRIVYDARGLGDSFSRFLDRIWTNPQTGDDQPALVDDDKVNFSDSAIPVLHPVRATNVLNNQIATRLRGCFQHKTLELPINTRIHLSTAVDNSGKAIQQNPQELAIYYQADALQVQLANVCQIVSKSGSFLYDTTHKGQHKDRYSSLAYVNDYVTQLQKKSILKHKRGTGERCVGVTLSLNGGRRYGII